MKKIEKSVKIGGRELTLSTGHVAGQASSAIMVSYGETVCLVTVVAAPMREDLGYFPLQVEYKEKLFAGGRIKGSRWVKRDGKPTDDEILTARLIDRFIRPLFPKDYEMDVQVIVTVLSIDMENSPDMPAAVAVSAALAASSIPWNGPAGIIKIGLKGDDFISNPKVSELEESAMELVISSTKESIVMIEAGANEVTESKILEGIAYGQKECQKLISFINDFAKAVGAKKEIVKTEKPNKSLQKKVKELSKNNLGDLIAKMATKEAGYGDYNQVKAAIRDSVSDEDKSQVGAIFDELFNSQLRKVMLSGKRPDGRKLDEIRDLSCQIEVLPRTHGSAIFNRGQTQALTITTVGAPSLEQLIETAEGEETKRYIHHYSMPPFSVGETGRIGFPKRREIGHGALAERALMPVIPSKDEFPYTIHVVTEILSSNGSTSMAATCGSTLSLMDAGVPIKTPVAGIAMGLIMEGDKKYKILTDISGIEDGGGDMDFKVAGTQDGITALQMDVKTLRLTLPMLEDALQQAKKARDQILKTITAVIAKPKSSVSVYAPKIKIIKIDKEKIGEVIGPGGRIIKAIIAETGAQVDVSDDGSINVSSASEEGVNAAIERIEALTKEVQAGEIYEGEVKRIQSFGAFVEVLPGKDGLVHVSDMSEEFVKDPSEVVKIGDKVKVRVKEIDQMGRINLSMLLDEKADERKRARQPRQSGERSFHSSSRPQGRFGGRDDRPRFSRGRFDRSGGRSQEPRERSKGPHFPTSRYLNDSKKGFSR